MSHTHESSSARAIARSLFAAAAICIGFIVIPAAALISQSGAPAKRTGAPGDGDGSPGNSGSCADVGCHNSYPVNSGVGGITLNAPTHFNPGVPVEFVVTVHDSTRFRFGFQTTIKNGGAENVGTFELIDSNTRFATGNTDYVTHTLANANAEWTVKWIPPAEISEDVTIYIAGNAADGRFTAASDYTYQTQAVLGYAPVSDLEETPEIGAASFDVFPNPTTQNLNVSYTLNRESPVAIEIFDVLGREVLSQSMQGNTPGMHTDALSLHQLPPGVYVALLSTSQNKISQLVTLVK